MTSSPALCPLCGSMLAVYESEAGAYLGCDEPGCLWMSVPLHLDETSAADLEDVLGEVQDAPGGYESPGRPD